MKSEEYRAIVGLIDEYGVKAVLRWAISGMKKYVKVRDRLTLKKKKAVSLKKLDIDDIREIVEEAKRKYSTKSRS